MMECSVLDAEQMVLASYLVWLHALTLQQDFVCLTLDGTDCSYSNPLRLC